MLVLPIMTLFVRRFDYILELFRQWDIFSFFFHCISALTLRNVEYQMQHISYDYPV